MRYAARFTATIDELGTDGQKLGVPAAVSDRIKAKDPNPFWVLFEVGREGASGGTLASMGKRTKRWLGAAIKELAGAITGARIFTDVHGDENDRNRPSFGEVVHGFWDTVNDKARAMAIAYIPEGTVRERIKKGELDICSVEAAAVVLDTGHDFIVESVESCGGLLIAAGSKEMPGFASAGVLQSVQELGKKEGEEDMTVTLADVKKFVSDNGTTPEKIFDERDLAGSSLVRGVVDSAVGEAVEKAKAEAEATAKVEVDKLTAQVGTLTAEAKPFREQAQAKRLNDMMTENEDLKKMTKEQAAAAMKMASRSIEATGGIDGKDDAQVATLITEYLNEGMEFVKNLGTIAPIKGDETPAPNGVQGDEGKSDYDVSPAEAASA